MTKQVVFFGSSDFSVVVLNKLLSAKRYELRAVVTTSDKPTGRHLKLTPNPVKVFAQEHNIPVVSSPQSGSIGLVAAYGKIIPQSTIDIFNGQIYNIHPSLLPKYRGPSPLQQQILDGITETGVTIIQLDALIDHGPVVAQEKDVILPNDTTITLGNRLFEIGANWFIENSFQISNFKFQIQDQGLATFTKKLTRQDGFIPWEQFHPEKLDRQFRAFIPWPGVWTTTPQGQRLKLIALQPQILVQLEGKTVQPWPIVV